MLQLCEARAHLSDLTVSFWVYTSVPGTYCAYLNNPATAGSSIASGTGFSFVQNFTVATANTWTFVTYTVPGFTAATWTPGLAGSSLAFVVGVTLYMSMTSGSQLNSATNATWMTAATQVYYSTTAISNTFTAINLLT